MSSRLTKLSSNLWLGNSWDAEHGNLTQHKIDALLCVAHDLEAKRGWSDGLHYAQCGLVDGPGNSLAAYHAAVLQLVAFWTDKRTVLVYDHTAGSRAVTVAIMGMHAKNRMGWDHWIAEIKPTELPHEAHRQAFDRINWRLLTTTLHG